MQWGNTATRGLTEVPGFFPAERFLAALNDSKVGVVICDRRMRYVALNESLAEIHNVPIDAHLGHFFHEIIGDVAEKVVPLWENVFSTGQPLINFEVAGHLPKRREAGRWLESLFPLKDTRGRVVQVGCFAIELSRAGMTAPHLAIQDAAKTMAKGHRIASSQRSDLPTLSPREQEVVRLVAEGQSNKEISSHLAISVRTVETYRARLMLKLKVRSTAQLVHYAIRHNLVTI